jgi:hypothetical protein
MTMWSPSCTCWWCRSQAEKYNEAFSAGSKHSRERNVKRK